MPARPRRPRGVAAVALTRALSLTAGALLLAAPAGAGLTFYVEPNNPWPSGWYAAAVADMQTVVNEYNAYGDFTQGNPGNIYVYYNSGIPTAQSGYGGWSGSIGDGGTYPNVRVLLHESSHWLGTGTYSAYWTGPHAAALERQFDGDNAVMNGDSQHYWPYGENYDSESSPVNDLRHVAMVYALRQDFGLVSVNPSSWAATNVSLTTSDNLGESGFNYTTSWSDNTFVHPNANYSTGNFFLRTPASSAPFTFAGNSLTINNTNGINGGLIFKGTGSTGTVTIKNLILNGGYVRHANANTDLFKLAGNVTLQGSPTIDAAQGAISLNATMSGPGSLTKTGNFLTLLNTGASYAGNTTISAGTLRLGAVSPVANYTFDSVSGATVTNTGTGGTAMNGTLAGGATIVPGHSGNAVSIASGASVDIANPITDLGTAGSWTVSAWVKTATPGATLLSKSDGSTWNYGNTVFYLGDGTDGGSGGIPSSVRWAGGYFQGSTAATNVANNAWHMVTYVNSGDNYALYVDGVAQPLSPGNSRLNVPDVGSVVRLGFTTDNGAYDGTVNLNGLLDDVRLYSQALSPTQVTSLYNGAPVTGTLPATTNLTVASGATFDLAGAAQQLAGLTGPSGSAVSLGTNGNLTVNASAPSSFAGTITGTSGSLVKSGSSSLTLTGTTSYTGATTVAAGTLTLGKNAWSPVLTGAGGADITGGKLLLDYTGATTPLPTAESRIWSGAIRSSAADALHTVAATDNNTSLVTIQLALKGDANLDGILNADDYALLDRGYAQHLAHWTNGDFNADGQITPADYLLLDSTYLTLHPSAAASLLPERDAQFGDTYVSALLASVPEPVALSSILYPLSSLLLKRRRRTAGDR